MNKTLKFDVACGIQVDWNDIPFFLLSKTKKQNLLTEKQVSKKRKMNEFLPNDIILSIFQYLELWEDGTSISLVSKQFYYIYSNNILWEPLLEEAFERNPILKDIWCQDGIQSSKKEIYHCVIQYPFNKECQYHSVYQIPQFTLSYEGFYIFPLCKGDYTSKLMGLYILKYDPYVQRNDYQPIHFEYYYNQKEISIMEQNIIPHNIFESQNVSEMLFNNDDLEKIKKWYSNVGIDRKIINLEQKIITFNK